MKKSKRSKRTPHSKKEKLHFEKIAPLNRLLPDKLLKEKLHNIQKSPIFKNIGVKVKSGMRIVSEQATRLGKTAKGIALQTQTHVKIAQLNAKINKLFMAIGEEVYEQSKHQEQLPSAESNMQRFIKKISEIENEISILEKSLTRNSK